MILADTRYYTLKLQFLVHVTLPQKSSSLLHRLKCELTPYLVVFRESLQLKAVGHMHTYPTFMYAYPTYITTFLPQLGA